jgi:hypothetical protein
VSPALIELLRSPAGVDALPSEDRKDEYAFGAVRGLLVGAAAGLPTWFGIIWLIRNLFS